MAFDTEIEAVSKAGVFQRGRAVNEKHGVNETRRVSFARQKSLISVDVFNGVFLAEFGERLLCKSTVCRRLRLRMQ